MESNDREILITIYEGQLRLESRLGKVESRLDGVESRLEKLETRVGHVEAELGYLQHDANNLSTFMYWGIGIIGLFIAAATLPGAIAAALQPLREIFKAQHSETLNEDALIERIIERLNKSRAV